MHFIVLPGRRALGVCGSGITVKLGMYGNVLEARRSGIPYPRTLRL